MFLAPITRNELENEIKNMKSNASPGYDNISNNIIKLIANEISKLLTHIFNLTFHYGLILDKLKFAIVTPIFNGGETNKYEKLETHISSFLFF